ncbi:hypothetical protein SJ05684_c30280 [Sinorhizobium sojae CCBAU 05684]|uniref:Uncharacterized protein n=1 Tax=Sinorhizobium sojae CCBAU 05684 TaxID=716928 RepID=A0A249PFC2_9HYPH|nr:hypothetical protein [Sinorhizobium sojae]ASY64452.1 hypothetical protein SJ05684_c30280 [Sinorhizobium sojae CCBAU 05684]
MSISKRAPDRAALLKSIAARTNDFILLATIITLGMFAMLSLAAVKEYERQLAIEARV